VFSRLDYGSATLAGLPKQLMDRLQSVQNAAARLIFKACRQDQPLLRRLHWPRMPERISFRLALLVYRCLHGSAPGYLASDLQCVSHVNARRRLCSSITAALVAPRTVRSTIGDRTFPVTAGLEHFAGVRPVISVVASFLQSQQTENRTFCPALQPWLRTSHCTNYYYVTSLFMLIVTCPCSLRT